METQKKGVMYVYKMASGTDPTPEIESPVKKPVVPRGYWGLRKSKTYRESDHMSGGQRAVEGGGDVVEVRKSVSAVGRRSVSHVETNVASVAAFLQVKVLVTDMPGFMQVHAFRCARTSMDSLEKFSTKHIAHNLKKGTAKDDEGDMTAIPTTTWWSNQGMTLRQSGFQSTSSSP
ncbi:hypothetical protein RHSIM_Rhsim01G0076200 [Rhododendron simsii]|uniref:Dynein light chain n=1 Tax=Rhododendron simsii TaxID=118357 RepID=A0A834HJ07_RHOSS|nr:hypothetical protein RHSIM_Rhsim01G0076200 [Rhododendron simsii]